MGHENNASDQSETAADGNGLKAQAETRAERKAELEKKARDALANGNLSAEDALSLCKKLSGLDEFGLPARLLAKLRASDEVAANPSLDQKFRCQLTFCTYKDTHLNDEHRLNLALDILDECDYLKNNTDPESLGLAGAIHRRRWEIRYERTELELALSFYLRGHEADKTDGKWKRQGYPGINAAFLLNQLAKLESDKQYQGRGLGRSAADLKGRANDIRKELIAALQPMLDDFRQQESLSGDCYWLIVTIAEANLGLGKFDQAKSQLKEANKLQNISQWQFETTAKQLARLGKLLEFPDTDSASTFSASEFGQTLLPFLNGSEKGLLSAYVGKVGLAFSGGGFRASLFHIGVLARLAELDQLRQIEVISCVSGGSILGAYYYLELAQLLKEFPDAEISQQQYIEIVKRIENNFLRGVQTNLRMRIAAEWLTNCKMIFTNYSRTHRLAELYEEELYRHIDDGKGNAPRYMEDLYILPKDQRLKGEKSFDPRQGNWCRANKVPILILNATTLNTGHNWQFTASWMGEPPTTIHPEIDSNYRLRRVYYSDLKPAVGKVRLGTAVGASSCVPGLFEPVVLDGLYENNGEVSGKQLVSVKLVDGGVHDNQGVVGLKEQDCDVMFVSDASGQMETEDNPSSGIVAVALRANSILMSRTREAEYGDLQSRWRSGELRDLTFLHFKKDLSSTPLDWVGCETSEADAPLENEKQVEFTSYNINKKVQQALANNRTDLDAWNDAEAYTLMLSGYRMAEGDIKLNSPDLHIPNSIMEGTQWDFKKVDSLQMAASNASYMRILQVGEKIPLKIWYLSRPLRAIGMLLLVGTGLFAMYLLQILWEETLELDVSTIALWLLTPLLTIVLSNGVVRLFQIRQSLRKILFGFGMATIGFFVAKIHLTVLNRMYLSVGKIDNLTKKNRED